MSSIELVACDREKQWRVSEYLLALRDIQFGWENLPTGDYVVQPGAIRVAQEYHNT